MTPRPLAFAGRPAVQHDPTSCGAACLVVLRALGDPGTLRLLETDPAAFEAAMTDQRGATARGALGPLPWPRALGTPPWTAAREASYPGVRYVSRPLLRGSRAPDALRRALDAAHRATAAGLPVPLYSGHRLLDRLPAAVSGATLRRLGCGGLLDPVVPRHVVLALPADGPAPGPGVDRPARDASGAPLLHVYEPGTGLVHDVGPDELAGARRPEWPYVRGRAALGGWTELGWILLPTRR